MTARGHLEALQMLHQRARRTINPIEKARLAEAAVEQCVPLLADLVERVEQLEAKHG